MTLRLAHTERLDSLLIPAAWFRTAPDGDIYDASGMRLPYDPRNHQWVYQNRTWNIVGAKDARITYSREGVSVTKFEPGAEWRFGLPEEWTEILIAPIPPKPQRRRFSPIPREPGKFITPQGQGPLTGAEKQRLPLTTRNAPPTEPM